MLRLKVISFPATNIKLAKIFTSGHQNALTEEGTQSIGSNNIEWYNNDDVYCVLVCNQDNQPVAGGRIEILNENRAVPLQNISDQITERVNHYMNNFPHGELVAEYCAIWVHPKYRNNQLATEMTKFVISKMSTLHINNTILIERQSSNITQRVGFSISDKLMCNDEHFLYPTPKYQSVIREIRDLKRYLNFDFCKDSFHLKEYYEQINSYIQNPIGTIIIETEKNTVQISYDLSM